jgi:hypothetical protein
MSNGLAIGLAAVAILLALVSMVDTSDPVNKTIYIDNTSVVNASFDMELLQLTQDVMQQHDSTANLAIEWKRLDIDNDNFAHDISNNSHQITALNGGWLHVIYSVQYDQDDTGRLNTEAYLTINGSRVEFSTANRPYYRGLNYGRLVYIAF